MEVLKAMPAREVLNLIEWLKSKNFTSDDIVDCIEFVEGKKKKDKEEKDDQEREIVNFHVSYTHIPAHEKGKNQL